MDCVKRQTLANERLNDRLNERHFYVQYFHVQLGQADTKMLRFQ